MICAVGCPFLTSRIVPQSRTLITKIGGRRVIWLVYRKARLPFSSLKSEKNTKHILEALSRIHSSLKMLLIQLHCFSQNESQH